MARKETGHVLHLDHLKRHLTLPCRVCHRQLLRMAGVGFLQGIGLPLCYLQPVQLVLHRGGLRLHVPARGTELLRVLHRLPRCAQLIVQPDSERGQPRDLVRSRSAERQF